MIKSQIRNGCVVLRKLAFLKNAMLLTITSLILRSLGMVFRIYVSRMVGEEGMGLYQLISSVYFLMITFAQSGISVSMTKLVTEKLALGDNQKVKSLLKGAVLLSLTIGITVMLVLFFGAPLIANMWIGDARAVLPLRILSLSLPFMSVCSVFSGYFVARRNVVHNCVSQMLEQISRMAVVFMLATLISNGNITTLLAAVVAGNTVSEFFAMCYSGISFALDKRKAGINGKTAHPSIGPIVKTAAPIAASRYLATALHTAENMLVPTTIARYTGSRESALSQFGALKGMALPILFFPSSFLNALSTLLVPEVTSANAKKQNAATKSIVDRACAVTLTLSIMIGGVFTMFAHQIGLIVYGSSQVGFMISVLAPITPFMYMDTIADGMLKGLNKQTGALKHSSIDSAIRIVLIIALVPFYGIRGFLFVMIVSNILISSLNMHLLFKSAGTSMRWGGWVVKPVLCTVIATIATRLLIPSAAALITVALGAALWCAVYGITLAVLRFDCVLSFIKKHLIKNK